MTTDISRPQAAHTASTNRPARRRTGRSWLTVARANPRAVIGVLMIVIVVGTACIGPLLAPHSIAEPIGIPGSPPSHDALLGTDFLGRDVLSRLLNGGLKILLVSVIAGALSYAIGLAVGMTAGYSRGRLDPILMRGVDLFISVPSLLVLLVLIAGAGASSLVLILGTAIVSFSGVARLVRTATLEASTAGYVEAAVARGERPIAVMRREILPNIAPALVADAGVRFISVIYLVASLGFLGFGSNPPAASWGMMVAENRPVTTTNIFAMLAPAVMLALLTVGVNLVGDAYVSRGRRTR